ncbi:hypothetical protein POM88_005234 [Heracleum sosnowskyi]|uniref:Uncharacterized protein n=1 Tax=Heracleum sosnowskyi TaxID=360622 RepID=A0AAD8JLJ2_9APIA|nr:hypothetical protein POM88_005234 [Heracleum sosnowskyi]
MGREKRNQNKFMRIITLPIRFLKKGRDMYVKSMMDVAYKPRYASSQMMGSRHKTSKASSALPKSFSTSLTPSWASNLEGDDLRELIRANSTAYNNDPTNKLRMDMELYIQQLIKEQQVEKLKESLLSGNNKFSSSKEVVPRSCSVGMGKIDEETPFEEGEEEEEGSVHVKKNEVKFPRSRSHAVTQTSSVF